MATDEDPQNFILMHAAGANVSGQIASVIAGGFIACLTNLRRGDSMSADLMKSLELLLLGWGGVFVVILIIYLASMLLSKLFPIKK